MNVYLGNPLPLSLGLVAFGLILSVTQLAQAASFTATNALTITRARHTATLLSNGKLLVTGGYDSDGNVLSSTELYDLITGTWTAAAPMNTPRSSHTATRLSNGKVLIAGGTGVYPSGALSSTELYDPVAGTWATTGSLNTPRAWGWTMTLLPNGKVLVAGGTTNFPAGTLSGAELYNPATGTWVATGDMNTGRYLHTATLLPNGGVLVTGGQGRSIVTNTADVYDPVTARWTATGVMATPRALHTATLLPNGKVLIAGGANRTTTHSSAELYEPATGKWTATTSMGTARSSHTATLLPNGKVLVAGGTGAYPSGALSSAKLYDSANGTWTATGALNTARANGYTATLLRTGHVLVAGGYSTPSSLSSVEIYDLVEWTVTAMTMTIPSMLPSSAFQFAFAATPNGTNTVLTTTNFASTNWAVLGVVLEYSPGLFLFTDPQATNGTIRFYRIRSP